MLDSLMFRAKARLVWRARQNKTTAPIVPLSKSTSATYSASESNVIGRYRQILHSAVEAGIITLDRGGLITGWSEGARRILGWTEEEMLGQSLARIFPAASGGEELLKKEMEAAVTKGRGGHEGWRLRKNGDQFWAVGEMTPLMDHQPEPIGFVKILRDLTEVRQAEIGLREETRALEILHRTGTALSRETNLDVIVQAVTDAGVALTDAEFGAFFYNVTNSVGESYMLYTLSGVPREAFSKFPMPRNTDVFAPTFSGAGIVRRSALRQKRSGKGHA
jgi:PAS domain S-box-containing protein